MPMKRKRAQWDYHAQGLVYHKVFVSKGMSKRLRTVAKEAGVPVSRLIADILAGWEAQRKASSIGST